MPPCQLWLGGGTLLFTHCSPAHGQATGGGEGRGGGCSRHSLHCTRTRPPTTWADRQWEGSYSYNHSPCHLPDQETSGNPAPLFSPYSDSTLILSLPLLLFLLSPSLLSPSLPSPHPLVSVSIIIHVILLLICTPVIMHCATFPMHHAFYSCIKLECHFFFPPMGRSLFMPALHETMEEEDERRTSCMVVCSTHTLHTHTALLMILCPTCLPLPLFSLYTHLSLPSSHTHCTPAHLPQIPIIYY